MGTLRKSKRSSEDARQKLSSYNWREDPHLVTRVNDLADIVQVVGWHTGMVLCALSFKRVHDGWLLVIKAMKGKRFLVAYHHTEELTSAVMSVGELVKGKYLFWKTDDYPTDFQKSSSSGAA